MRLGWLLSLSVLACCAPRQPAPEVDGQTRAIIYGADDRIDVYELEAPTGGGPTLDLRSLTRASVVALIRQEMLHRPPSGRVELVPSSLESAYGVCETENFRDQPVAADCSGVLIDEDLVLTAAHCFDVVPCEEYAFVFDYFYSASGTLESITSGDVFNCRQVVARMESGSTEARQIDFAVVQIDRPVTAPRKPVEVRVGAMDLREPVTAIGFPSGLPAKIDRGARVIDARAGQADFFSIDSDTFRGSSGSGIFDSEGALVGTLVRGGEDYVERGSCAVANVVKTSEVSSWEEATYVHHAVDALCSLGWPSAKLCDIEATCGDGFCSNDELSGSCIEDCSAASCLLPPCSKSPTPDVEVGDAENGVATPATDLGPKGCSAASSSPRGGDAQLLLSAFGLLLVGRRRRSAHAKRKGNC